MKRAIVGVAALAGLLLGLLAAAPAQAAPTPDPSTGSEVIQFGEDHGIVWDDMMQASVMSAESYTPDDDAVGLAPGHTGLRITIKITNGSPAPVDLTDASVTLKAGDDGVQSERLFDIENNVSTGFEGTVVPGRSATAVYGFSVAPDDLGLLNVELAPNLDYMPVIFEGAAS
jgi:hypothetical protein